MISTVLIKYSVLKLKIWNTITLKLLKIFRLANARCTYGPPNHSFIKMLALCDSNNIYFSIIYFYGKKWFVFLHRYLSKGCSGLSYSAQLSGFLHIWADWILIPYTSPPILQNTFCLVEHWSSKFSLWDCSSQKYNDLPMKSCADH